MTWFAIPEGYSCVIRQNDTTLYGYQGSRRDIFTVNGLQWERTATSMNSSLPSNHVCVTTPQIPSSILTGLVVGGVLLFLGFASLLSKIIKRTYL